MTTAEICATFDFSRRHLLNMKQAGCPVVALGGRGRSDTYDSAAVHRWLVDQAVGNGAKDPETRAARLEILKTESEIRKLKLGTRRGDLIERSRAFDIFRDCYAAIFSGIKGATMKICATLGQTTPKAVHSVDELLRAVLFSLYVTVCDLMDAETGVETDKEWNVIRRAWKEAPPTDWRDWHDQQREREGGPELHGQPTGGNGAEGATDEK